MRARVFDLENQDVGHREVVSDVCVIGAGAAGLYLANRLSHLGVSVTVLDAGGEVCGQSADIGFEPRFVGIPYRGATEGRSFGLGGSTSRWGGLLVPHGDMDIPDRSDPHFAAWQHIVRVVQERGARVFSALDLSGQPRFYPFPPDEFGDAVGALSTRGLVSVVGEYLGFTRRNLRYLTARMGTGAVTVVLHAVAGRWSVRQGDVSNVTRVDAVSAGGKRLSVSAASFVIAAGTIESTRMLLEINHSTAHPVLPSGSEVGAYLSDHLSVRIAEVHSDDLRKLADAFAPRFRHGRMRCLRFMSKQPPSGTVRHFAHFLFDGSNAGFALARDILSGLQRRRLPALDAARARAAASGLVGLAFSRFVQRRLFIPRATPARLQLDVEQESVALNRVSLGHELDRYGRPVAVVRWGIGDRDHERIRMLSNALLEHWPSGSLGGIRLRRTAEATGVEPKPYDAYHPVGTCRMGQDSGASVNFDLRVCGTANLFVLSTAVFPSAGTANPTFSMLCLGDRLADSIAAPGSGRHIRQGACVA